MLLIRGKREKFIELFKKVRVPLMSDTEKKVTFHINEEEGVVVRQKNSTTTAAVEGSFFPSFFTSIEGEADITVDVSDILTELSFGSGEENLILEVKNNRLLIYDVERIEVYKQTLNTVDVDANTMLTSRPDGIYAALPKNKYGYPAIKKVPQAKIMFPSNDMKILKRRADFVGTDYYWIAVDPKEKKMIISLVQDEVAEKEIERVIKTPIFEDVTIEEIEDKLEPFKNKYSKNLSDMFGVFEENILLYIGPGTSLMVTEKSTTHSLSWYMSPFVE